MQQVDVIVVGAGPGGSTTAFLLARRGWQVLLLDRSPFPREKTCGDGLTPRAVATLVRLNAEGVVAQRALRVESARLYASPRADVTLPFDPHVAPLPPRGYILPRIVLDDLLRERAVEAGAYFRGNVRVHDVIRREDRVVGVEAQDGAAVQRWSAPVTVIATGAGVGLHRALGILHKPPHDVRAARGYWKGVRDLAPRFEFFFTPDVAPGYAWLFPVNEDTANIGVGVYAPPGTSAPSPHRLLHAFLQRHPELRRRLAGAELIAPVRGYPIRTDYPSHRVCGRGWVMVGEAAGLVNPVTGEGIDLALESAILAADAIHTALSSGDVRRLCAYERALRREFAHTFTGLRRLRRRVMRPRALELLIRRARRHPGLATRIMGITLGTVSPYAAFLPSTWWWILRGG